MTRTQRLWLSLIGLTLALGTAAWLVASVGDMHDRIARVSPRMAVGFVAIAVVIASATALVASRLLWKLGRDERPPDRAPEDVVAAADVQAREGRGRRRAGQGSGGPGPAPRRAGHAPVRPPGPTVPSGGLRHRVGREDLADQRPDGPGRRPDRAHHRHDQGGRRLHLRVRGRRRDRPPDRHAGPLRDRRGRGRPRGRGPRPRREGRPAPLRGGPRPDPLGVRADGRAGPAGEAVDRRPEQEGPAARRGPRGDPGQAPRAAQWAGRPVRRRRGLGVAPADAGEDPGGRRDHLGRSWRPSRPTSSRSATGSPRSSTARGMHSAPATCSCGPT